MRGLKLGLLTLGLVAISTPVIAQPPIPPTVQRPTFSPYLNLLNRGFSPAANYFGFVRPQLQMQQQFGQLQNQLFQANQSLQGLQAQSDQLMNDLGGGLPTTANIPTFMNTGHYFSYNPAMMSGGQTGGSRSFGSGPMMGGGGFGGPMMGGGGNFGRIPQPGSLPGGGQIGGARSTSRPTMGGASAGPRR